MWVVQIAILANQQNGKDTHIRSCLIWGPREGAGTDARGVTGRGEVEGVNEDEEEVEEEDEGEGQGGKVSVGELPTRIGHSPWSAIR